jgi:hypothetical protein
LGHPQEGPKQKWTFREIPNGKGGGMQKLYAKSSFPADVLQKMDAHSL